MSDEGADKIPWPLDAEVWVWVLGLVTRTDRFSLGAMWLFHRACQDAEDALCGMSAVAAYMRELGVDTKREWDQWPA